MKAIFFEEHGEIDVLNYASLPEPVPNPREAIVRVRAVALNHLDIWVRRGWKGLQLDMPHITGCDVAGEIVSIPDNSSLNVGDRVIIQPGILRGEDEWTRRGLDSVSPNYSVFGEHVRGGMAELAVVPADNLYRFPENLDFENAAAPILVGTTCWRMLFHRAKLRGGQSVLVVGSGGGVNSMSIQLASACGASVIALAGSKEKAKKAREIGAHETIRYDADQEWYREVLKITRGRGVDVVVDNVGAKTIHKSLRAVARGGVVVTVGNTSGPTIQFDNRFLFTKQVSLVGSTMGSRQDFVDAMDFLWKKNIRAVIDSVEPLQNGIDMIARMEQGKHFGKIVLVPE